MTDQSNIPLGETHAVENVASELGDYNLFTTDSALVDAVAQQGGAWGLDQLSAFGADVGRQDYRELGYAANRYPPELETHDRFGRRTNAVHYHDAYHQLMRGALENGLHSAPWAEPGPGAHVVRSARQLMHAQVEAGHGCPITMTFAAIPSLRVQPDIAARFEDKILACAYDPRNLPLEQKTALTVGMGMTEKQGGSDVRANATRATPVAEAGPGQLYSLVGHKWFLSAPMCDLFLILANTDAGVSCFLVPRWLPEGEELNALYVVRLKDKMGNRSNASSEVELRGAQGWLIGEEGRGVATIIEMVSLTRVDCIAGSAGLMRAGVAEAIHHCSERAAFGARLIDQPLMRNVLADLALEYEAASAVAMRLSRALDGRDSDPHEAHLARLATAVGKYWVCKRTPGHTYEIMECIGGNGVMENSVYPRLFRESVINPIWEGSGNVQCLDVLRAMAKEPAAAKSFLAELDTARGGNARLDHAIDGLKQRMAWLDSADPADVQCQARDLVDQMALCFQAALLAGNAPAAVGDAFCNSRLAGAGMRNYGTLPEGSDLDLLIERADPGRSVTPDSAGNARRRTGRPWGSSR